MPIIQTAGALSALCFSAIYLGESFGLIAAVMIGFGFFWNAMLPQFEAVTFSYLGSKTAGYSRIRLWGSVGFVAMVVVLGWGLSYLGIDQLPLVLLLLLTCIWVVSLTLSDPVRQASKPHSESLLGVVRRPVVIVFLLVCLLLQMSHGPYYVFFSIYLDTQGYSKPEIGQLWALGVVAEIVLFYWMQHLVSRVSLQLILLMSLGLTVIRWLMIGWLVNSLPALLFAQLLHAASFGAFHVVAIHLVHHYFHGQHQGRGQALYSSISFGAGGMLGSLFSGYLWQDLGPSWAYSFAGLLSLLATWLAWKWSIAQSIQLDALSPVEINPQER